MKKLLTIIFICASFAGFSQARKIAGFDPLTGRPGYILYDTLSNLYVVSPLYDVNDSTIAMDTTRMTITSFTKNATGDSTILLFGDGRRLAVRDSIGSGGGGAATDTAYDVVQADGAGVVVNGAKGFNAINTTAAAAGSQQNPPIFQMGGYGWKTAATAASQPVIGFWKMQIGQATSAPFAIMDWGFNINSAGYTPLMNLTSNTGALVIGISKPWEYTLNPNTGVISSTNSINISPAALSSGTMMTFGGNTHSGNISGNTYTYHKLSGTHTGGTGAASQIFSSIEPVINLTGTPTTGFYTAQRINVTETAINGAVTNYLFRAGTGGASFTSKFDITNNGDVIATKYQVSALNAAPANATDTGTTGEIRITATHIYVCTATNVWVRAALATW